MVALMRPAQMESGLGRLGRLAIVTVVGIACCMPVMAQTVRNYDTLVQQGEAQLQVGSPDLALSSGKAAIHADAEQLDANIAAGGDKTRLTADFAKINNAEVDRFQALAQQFNSEIRTFKAR